MKLGKRLLVWNSILLLICKVQFAHSEDPPTLSIGSLISTVVPSELTGHDNRQTAIRDQLVTELLERYECRLLTRCRGFDVAVERSIHDISSITNLVTSGNQVPAADYVIMANYRGTDKAIAITGLVYCTNINSPTKHVTECGFQAASVFDIPEAMSVVLAGELGLKSRTNSPALSSLSSVRPLTWAVLPFMRMDTGGADADGLALAAESAPVDGSTSRKLVDRQTIDAVLREHDITTFSGANDSVIRMLGTLINADRFLTGQVSLWKGGLRLDVHLLDTKTG